ncbi:MAG: glycosyltransferase family 9 protein [Candidatus Binatia bacterium]
MRRIVVVPPGSSANGRRAPLSLFDETLEGARAEREITVIVVGTAEKLLASSLLAVMPSRVDGVTWAGRVALVELAALLSRADLFIGNDSGPPKLAEDVSRRSLTYRPMSCASPSLRSNRTTSSAKGSS